MNKHGRAGLGRFELLFLSRIVCIWSRKVWARELQDDLDRLSYGIGIPRLDPGQALMPFHLQSSLILYHNVINHVSHRCRGFCAFLGNCTNRAALGKGSGDSGGTFIPFSSIIYHHGSVIDIYRYIYIYMDTLCNNNASHHHTTQVELVFANPHFGKRG